MQQQIINQINFTCNHNHGEAKFSKQQYKNDKVIPHTNDGGNLDPFKFKHIVAVLMFTTNLTEDLLKWKSKQAGAENMK